MSKQLKQVINLAQKTGDRIIVFDNSAPDDSFVLMPLEQYESLVQGESLTDKKIVDKIDSEKNNNNNNNGKPPKSNGNSWKIPEEVKGESEE